MAHRYVLSLMTQYSKETGNKESTIDDRGFLDWVKQYKETIKLLKKYYIKLGINIDSPRVYETDKGKSDTMIGDVGKQITHYLDPYEYIDYNNDGILVRTNSLKRNSNRIELPISDADLIFTFNPYEFKNIAMYNDISLQNIPVSIAMTGMLDDLSKKDKIDDLKHISKYIPECEYVEAEEEGRYFHVLYSRSYIDHTKYGNLKPKATTSNPQTTTYGQSLFRAK